MHSELCKLTVCNLTSHKSFMAALYQTENAVAPETQAAPPQAISPMIKVESSLEPAASSTFLWT